MIRPILRELATGSRIGKFASVGILGATIDLTISTILVLRTDILPEFAKLIGAEAAIIVMFFVNDRWTFADAGSSGRWNTFRRLVKSNLVRSGGLLVQFLVVRFLTRTDVSVLVAGTDIWPVLTMPIAIGTAFIFNYTAESLFTWRVLAQDS